MAYVLRRAGQSVFVVAAVAIFIFVLVRLTGDPAAIMLGQDATAEDLAQIRARLGLDLPIHEQLWIYLSGAVQGDFGTSIRHGEPAVALVLERLPATLELALAAVLVVALVGIPLGLLAGLRRDTLADFSASALSLLAQSIPNFWLGIMLILVFSVNFNWLPASGRGGPEHLILPAVTLASFTLAAIARLQRSTVIETLRQDYVRTARAKGLAGTEVVRRHVLKNSSIPVVTVLGLQVPVLFGGAIVTETVFSYPGMGLLAIDSIAARDFPIIQAFVMVIAVLVVVTNLLIDLLYRRLDPRIRYE